MARNRVPAAVSGKRRAPGQSHARPGSGPGSGVQSAPAQVEWAPGAFEDYRRWRKIKPALVRKIDSLIADILRSPFSGIGKPEPLKHALVGRWSRRINQEHRLVYSYEAGVLSILSCRYHY